MNLAIVVALLQAIITILSTPNLPPDIEQRAQNLATSAIALASQVITQPLNVEKPIAQYMPNTKPIVTGGSVDSTVTPQPTSSLSSTQSVSQPNTLSTLTVRPYGGNLMVKAGTAKTYLFSIYLVFKDNWVPKVGVLHIQGLTLHSSISPSSVPLTNLSISNNSGSTYGNAIANPVQADGGYEYVFTSPNGLDIAIEDQSGLQIRVSGDVPETSTLSSQTWTVKSVKHDYGLENPLDVTYLSGDNVTAVVQ